MCATIESEAAELGSEDDIAGYLKELGMEETGLSQVIRLSSELLGMHTFYTVGPQGAVNRCVVRGLVVVGSFAERARPCLLAVGDSCVCIALWEAHHCFG